MLGQKFTQGRFFMSIFKKMTLEHAFELLLNRKIIAKEFKQANKIINKLKNNDWRFWFGKFLIFVRSDAKSNRFTDAYSCLAETESLLKEIGSDEDNERFLLLINNESLFLVFKFYYGATGLASLALLLARFYQNGWGVKKDIQRAREFAEKAITMPKNEPIYKNATEVLNSILLEISNSK